MKVFLKPYHLFEINGEHFLFKIKSLRHERISSCEAELLEQIDNKVQIDADDALLAVLNRHRLIAQERWDEEKVSAQLVEAYRSRAHMDDLALMELFVSQSCNMGCIYCYGSDGSYHERGKMNLETALHAIDWYHARCKRPRQASIVFFGGEPLMNFDLIRSCVEYAEQRFGEGVLTYGMATNMVLMTDERLDFFASLPKFYLLVSIDGPREIQNRQRPLLDGRSSYDVCVERIEAAMARGIQCTGRATVYADTDRDAVVNEMKRLGFSSWQLTPASGCASDGVARDNASRLYQRWIEEMPEKARAFIAAVKQRSRADADRLMADDDLRRILIEGAGGAEIERELMGCAAGRTQIAVSANGKVYPCHRFVGMQDFCLGELDRLKEGWKEFSRSRLERNSGCKDCFLRFSCRGECYYQCYSDGPGKSIFAMPEYFCEFMRVRTMLKICIAHSLDAEDKLWFFTRKFAK